MDDTLKILSQHSRLSEASLFEGRPADLLRRPSHSSRDGETVGPSPDGVPTDPTRPTDDGGTRPLDPSFPGIDDILAPKCIAPGEASHPLNDKYLFLREIGGVSCLRSFLNKLVIANEQGNYKHRHWGCTLVIDQEVKLFSTLVLPAHFTLAGIGSNGAGALQFVSLQPGEPALTLQKHVAQGLVGYTTIRDLRVDGLSSGQSAGILLEEPQKGDVWLTDVRVQGFGAGVVGRMTRNVTLANCTIANNATNIALTDCTGWRARDCNLMGATNGWGISARSGVSDLVIEGCRIRGNSRGGVEVRKDAFGVVIMSNIIVGNLSGLGVKIHSGALSTRILWNAFDGNKIDPEVAQPATLGDTQMALNAAKDQPDDLIKALV